MSLRSIVLSVGVSLCLSFVGCKSDPAPAPAPAAQTTPAVCAKCGHDPCTCAAAPAPAATH
jgi:hypothetical protein